MSSAKSLHEAIIYTFGNEDDDSYMAMSNNIQEDLENGYTVWRHIHELVETLLPKSYQYNYASICPLIQHVKRTRRVGLTGLLHHQDIIYNIDAILSFF